MAKKARSKQKEKLFEEKLVPSKQGSGRLFDVSYGGNESQPVECLGMTFENDEARRQYFLEKLREKLQDPEFRKIEGFPIGDDEDILAMSDPPYYTACPNPFLEDALSCYGHDFLPDDDEYHNEPFASDVSEGKTDAVYNAHSYPTKVPPKAIMRYILHYTKPGDVIFDGFCGTGMTGVAANLCGHPDPEFKSEIEQQSKLQEAEPPQWGARRAFLSDLSPLATFVAHNYNSPLNEANYDEAVTDFFRLLEKECAPIYETIHDDGTRCRINYTVWSEVFNCQDCADEVVFLREALDEENGQVAREFPCPSCGATVSKRSMSRTMESFYDCLNDVTARRVKRVPVFINYTHGGDRKEKPVSEADMSVLRALDQRTPAHFFPAIEMPFMHVTHIKDKMSNFGISHFSHFFLSRPRHCLAAMWDMIQKVKDIRIRHAMCFTVEQCIPGMSILNRYSPTHYSQSNRVMSGVYYVPSQHSEVSPWYILRGKTKRLSKVFASMPNHRKAFVSLNSGTRVGLPDNCVDYIFTDPPFGANLQYSELNWFVESFYRLKPATDEEAVVNKAQKKGIGEYLELMLRCFEENYRILKPGRWMTVEFHNSSNAIWNAIQEAILRAGFVVAAVRMLDKKGETYKQSKQGVVKADLIISAYKPEIHIEEAFRLEAGTEAGVWDFVRNHLEHLPVFVTSKGKAESIGERQEFLLFDRMVAFHVQRGVSVPLSAAEFRAGLRQRFPMRDDMYFSPEHVAEYDKKRLACDEIVQLPLFVSDESSAIQWLKQQLSKTPQSFQEIQPKFMKEGNWQKHEKQLELSELLEQNFLCFDGKSDVPSQIHSYLSTNFHEYRNLDKDDPKLIAKAKNRWYVPDPRKEADLEKIRHRALMKEFDGYRESKKKLKVVRTEAVRAGFRECWQTGDYQSIVEMARRVKDDIIQEDPALLMYYDNAVMRTEE